MRVGEGGWGLGRKNGGVRGEGNGKCDNQHSGVL